MKVTIKLDKECATGGELQKELIKIAEGMGAYHFIYDKYESGKDSVKVKGAHIRSPYVGSRLLISKTSAPSPRCKELENETTRANL